MAFDAFLKLGDIKGESLDDKHKDQIEILSFSWGESRPPSTGGGGGGGGTPKASAEDFRFTMATSKASPAIFVTCAAGELLKDATLYLRKAGGGQPQDYFIVKLEDTLITSFNLAGEQGVSETPVEELALNFSKMTVTYFEQKTDGSFVKHEARFDFEKQIKG